jgi:hypothetical protein
MAAPQGLYVVLEASLHDSASTAGGPPTCGLPTNMDDREATELLLPAPLALPVQYSLQAPNDLLGNPDAGTFCGAGFAVEVYWYYTSPPYYIWPTAIGQAQCGCVDGQCAGVSATPYYGFGGPNITCSNVVCNVTITP